tara:strand:+ start:903 stop:1544 length:642 start_codon:yes stop_codon:yes gene_type:complete
MWVFSYIKGLFLGTIAYSIGAIMDLTISRNSFKKILENIPKLYDQALTKIKTNMLVISPIVYCINDQYLIDHSTYSIQYGNVLGILMIHGIGYYIVHRSMHVVSFLRKYHNFHHEFDEYIMPSIGNAVSTEEFLTAYIAPFILSAYILHPNETSFVIPIALISIFNNIIHCKELENVEWSKYFVAPKQHLEHHSVRTKHYAAPIVNLDYFLEN